MEENHHSIIKQWLDAHNNRDIHSLLELHAEDAQYVLGGPETQVYEGREILLKELPQVLSAIHHSEYALKSVHHADNAVLLYLECKDGKPTAVAHLDVEKGKIAKTFVYHAPHTRHSIRSEENN